LHGDAHQRLGDAVLDRKRGVGHARPQQYLKALMDVRNEIVAAGYTPSAEVPTERDLDEAIDKLVAHELDRREVTEK
jgi:hypothetical protein